MTKKKPRITVIVPLRLSDEKQWILERLTFIRRDHSAAGNVHVLVIDDASPAAYATKIRMLCSKLGYDYLRLTENEGRPFSIARCRNQGAMHAKTRYIFFQDVDLLPTQGFYKKLDREIDIVCLPEHGNNMIMIPVAYLTREATARFLQEDGSDDMLQEYLDRILHRDSRFIEKFSPGTSACLYDRYYFLQCGGNSEQFEGWGYEDFEFNTRVILDSHRYPTPAKWQLDLRLFDQQCRYQGWKAAYRLFGDRSFHKGLVLFHAWHEKHGNTDYTNRKRQNYHLFLDRMRRFHRKRQHPDPPLPALDRGKTLLFRKNAYTFSRELQPLLGQAIFRSEHDFPDKITFVDFIRQQGCDRVLFHNPYCNAQMQRLYQWARKENIPFIIAERGALNDSVLYDSTGFLADSTLFRPECWNTPLDARQQALVEHYIHQERCRTHLLEAQGRRLSPEALKKKLGIGARKKVLLVCLQRPNDTATLHFQAEMGGYDAFLQNLKQVIRQVEDDFTVLVKRHPLEDRTPELGGRDVSRHHLLDLFGIADCLVVYNSGTGVQAMLHDLPVITCGRAFYDHPLLTIHAESLEALLRALRDVLQGNVTVNRQARRQFLHYLISRYYSFGRLTTKSVRMNNGDRMTATTHIAFNVLRFDGIECRYRTTGTVDDGHSMLFDRYTCGHWRQTLANLKARLIATGRSAAYLRWKVAQPFSRKTQ